MDFDTNTINITQVRFIAKPIHLASRKLLKILRLEDFPCYIESFPIDFQWLSAKKTIENCIEALRERKREKNKPVKT